MADFKIYTPPSLQNFVKSFWYLQVDQPITELITPDGHQEIIIHTAADNAIRQENDSWTKESCSFFSGQTTHSYKIHLKKNAVLYGVRFYPHTMHLFFDINAVNITDSTLPLAEVAIAKKLENLIDVSVEKSFSNFENYLCSMLNKGKAQSNKFAYVDFCIKQIVNAKGQIKIDRLKQLTGISGKYLDTLFNDHVGIAPKKLCNILQLNNFINQKSKNPLLSFTECCYEAGFADQAHSIKIFRIFTGLTPRDYFSTPNKMNASFIS